MRFVFVLDAYGMIKTKRRYLADHDRDCVVEGAPRDFSWPFEADEGDGAQGS